MPSCCGQERLLVLQQHRLFAAAQTVCSSTDCLQLAAERYGKTQGHNICNLRERVEVAVAYSNQILIFLPRMTKMRDSVLF
jgi:hypothetical protein